MAVEEEHQASSEWERALVRRWSKVFMDLVDAGDPDARRLLETIRTGLKPSWWTPSMGYSSTMNVPELPQGQAS